MGGFEDCNLPSEVSLCCELCRERERDRITMMPDLFE